MNTTLFNGSISFQAEIYDEKIIVCTVVYLKHLCIGHLPSAALLSLRRYHNG